MKIRALIALLALVLGAPAQQASEPRVRARDLGIQPGVLPTGKLNAITDVAGVKVGQVTLRIGDNVRTGVTAILPHDGNIFQRKVPAAVYAGNGFGKLIGSTQIDELGVIESPIVLTNTLSVWRAAEALAEYVLGQKGNENVRSVNVVVGETNDGTLNDIRGMHVQKSHVQEALAKAAGGAVEEGSVGAGTGTIAFGFKGGIGTSSRVAAVGAVSYTVGVLVQTNFGGILSIGGAPVGRELGRYYLKNELQGGNGSIMIVVATDAPLEALGLERLARRAFLGVARTGSPATNGSGDFALAFSTAASVRRGPLAEGRLTRAGETVAGDHISPLFEAVVEATEEAIVNSLFKAETVRGYHGTVTALPIDSVVTILREHRVIP